MKTITFTGYVRKYSDPKDGTQMFGFIEDPNNVFPDDTRTYKVSCTFEVDCTNSEVIPDTKSRDELLRQLSTNNPVAEYGDSAQQELCAFIEKYDAIVRKFVIAEEDVKMMEKEAFRLCEISDSEIFNNAVGFFFRRLSRRFNEQH